MASVSFFFAAAYAARPASRSFWTSLIQSALPIGTGFPFEHIRPGIMTRLADSDSAKAAFSTACQPPYVVVSGFGEVDASGGTGCLLRSSCAAKMTFDAG